MSDISKQGDFLRVKDTEYGGVKYLRISEIIMLSESRDLAGGCHTTFIISNMRDMPKGSHVTVSLTADEVMECLNPPFHYE